MLFHKESKVAFLLTPRCGSTSLREYLEPLGFSYPLIRCEEEPFFRWHPTYEKCIEVYPNLKNYQMYAVFRDPIDRFISGLMFALTTKPLKLCTAKSYDDIVTQLFRWEPDRKLSGITEEIFTPQVRWLCAENVEPIPYYGFATRVHEITSGYNARGSRIARYNVTAASKFGPPSEAVKEFALERFSEDYEFGRRIGLLV